MREVPASANRVVVGDTTVFAALPAVVDDGAAVIENATAALAGTFVSTRTSVSPSTLALKPVLPAKWIETKRPTIWTDERS